MKRVSYKTAIMLILISLMVFTTMKQSVVLASAPVITVDANTDLGEISKGIFTHNHRYNNGGFGLILLTFLCRI
jgi:hypothetical protein